MNSALLVRRAARLRALICHDCLCRRLSSYTVLQNQHQVRKNEDFSVITGRTVLKRLIQRGLVQEIAGERGHLEQLLSTKPVTAYVGVDPTAPSMHVGHLLPFFALFWLSLLGHNAIAVVGGSTASVGDPTGRTTSRDDQVNAQRERNTQHLTAQLTALLQQLVLLAEKHGIQKNDMGTISVLDNSEWLNRLSIMEFLGTLGSKLRMGALLSRDTVKTKMQSQEGMSFAEFTYPLLQSWDWWHLFNENNVRIQIGGADQFGNIVTGIDSIKNLCRAQGLETYFNEKEESWNSVFGITVPLLTSSSGQKFGKSAGNAVWLDKTMTSIFNLYGFFVRTADADVERYLKLLTLLPLQRIQEAMKAHEKDASLRIPQHLLASEFVTLVHGADAAEEAQKAHRAMFRRDLNSMDMSKATISGSNDRLPEDWKVQYDSKSEVTLPESLVLKTPLPKILHLAGMVDSRNAGIRLVVSGGAYVGTRKPVNGIKQLVWTAVREPYKTTGRSFVVDKKFIFLRIGKWNVKVVNLVSDEEYQELGLAQIA